MAGFFWRLIGFKFRKRRRYRAKKGLYAVPEHQIAGNQIGDIGMGGLSYYYIDNGARTKKDAYGMLLMSENKTRKIYLSCQTVCDVEAGQTVSQNHHIKRRCIRFQHLNPKQKKELKHIIKDYTADA